MPLAWRLALSCVTLAYVSLLAACGTAPPAATSIALLDTCGPVNRSRALDAELVAPGAGALRIDVGEHGVDTSLRATPQRGQPSQVTSVVPRRAWQVLLMPVEAGERLAVEVASIDPAPAGGTACLRVRLLDSKLPGAHAELAAAGELTAAGQAVTAGRWRDALAHYSAAARQLDALGQTLAATEARLAMALIDTHHLDRDVDALAMVASARTDLAAGGLETRAKPLVAELLVAEAEALTEIPDTQAHDALVVQLLARSRALFAGLAAGQRELPRIDTLAGFWSFAHHDRAAARAAFERAAARCLILGDPECEARARQNLAKLDVRAAQPLLAEQEYQRARAVLPVAQTPELAADIDDNLSQLQGTLGLVSEAERLAVEAMRLHAQAADCEGGRRSLDGIGALLAEVGDSDAARGYLRAALLECGPLLEGIARRPAFGRTAPTPVAEDCRPPASAALRPETADGAARAIVALAALDLANGDVAAARRCADAAGPMEGLGTTRLRIMIAESEADLAAGEPERALGRLEAATREADRLGLPSGHLLRRQLDLAAARALLELKRPQQAWARATRVLRDGAARSSPGELLESLRLAAQSLRQAGYPELATGLLESGTQIATRIPVTALDPAAAASFVATQHALFSDLTDLLARAGLDAPALAAAESGRARAARAALARTRLRETGVPDSDGSNALLALRNDLAKHLAPIALAPVITGSEAQRVAGALTDALAESQAESRAESDATQRPEPSAADFTAYSERLPPHSAVIEYAAAGDDLVAFVLRDGTLQLVRLGPRSVIASRAARFLALLQDADTPGSLLDSAAGRLAELIWWPLPLRGAQSITVVPDDSLSAIPFAALPSSAARDAPPVVELARTGLIPSLRYAWEKGPAAPRSERGAYAVLGDPVFQVAEWQRDCEPAAPSRTAGPVAIPAAMAWTERLAPLPGAAAEVRDIAALTSRLRRGDPTRSLLACGATRGALHRLAGSPLQLLHLATHARIDPERPRLSAIALTPEWEGGTLRSTLGYAEIVAWQLKARLVILGACDTSRGQVLSGEGVLGPAQAFLQGGADSVVGTLWSVDDRATAAFMQSLYRHLLVERMPIGAALRRTQIEFLRNPGQASAHFWAAFTLFGAQDSEI